jgi:hypothetical protein
LLERDLQDYLFANPDVLFPGEDMLERAREVNVDGKRIDLLFRTKSVRYIVELKAVPLTREHVGQVAEYYGRLRVSSKDTNYKMILVAPSIPDYRKVFLEEIGIRCIEVRSIPTAPLEAEQIRKETTDQVKRERVEDQISAALPNRSSISSDDLKSPISKASLAVSHLMLRDSLTEIRTIFADYEIRPVKMASSSSQDLVGMEFPPLAHSNSPLIPGGAWWAYAFGASEQMPKNDVPNISAVAMPWGFDLTVNAELRTSQEVMKTQIARNRSRFDEIIREHGELQFQAILKLERQPRFYFWLPLVREEVGTWCAATLLETCDRISRDFDAIKEFWQNWIVANCREITTAQVVHMRRRSTSLNLALRLARPFPKRDKFWSLPYAEQSTSFAHECERLKPLIDFLR